MFSDGETDTGSTSNDQQLLPLALTKNSKSTTGPLSTGSILKQTAAEVTAFKTEESEGSTSSPSPPLFRNPTLVETEDPQLRGDNTQTDGSLCADLGNSRLFKGPLSSANVVVANGDVEGDDVPLALCVSKPGVEADMPMAEPNDDKPSSAEKNTSEPESNSEPLPDSTPPTSPKPTLATEEGYESTPAEAQEREATKGKDKGEAIALKESINISDEKMETGNTAEEGNIGEVLENPPVDPEPSLPALALQTQPSRSDKPYSCSQCGKAYASRSGLKVSLKPNSKVSWFGHGQLHIC